MKEKQIEVLNPTGRVVVGESKIAPRFENLNKKKMGIIDNQKENANVFLNHLKEKILSQFNIAETKTYKKQFPSKPMEFIDKISEECDFVLNGVAHWGASSSWSIHDSVQLETKGIPTATICTDEFARMAQFVARNLGLPGLPLVIVKHPLAGIKEETVIEKAKSVADEVIHVLTQPKEILESEFREKEYPLPTGVCPMTKPGI